MPQNRSPYRRIRNSLNEVRAMIRRAKQIDPDAWGLFGSQERQEISLKQAETEALDDCKQSDNLAT